MNTIVNLAEKWWNNDLDAEQRANISDKYHIEESIENIFYNEIIFKWWDSLKIIKQFNYILENNLSISFKNGLPTADELKQLYLKVHFIDPTEEEKEQILKERNTVIERNTEYPLTPNDCIAEYSKEEPKEKDIVDLLEQPLSTRMLKWMKYGKYLSKQEFDLLQQQPKVEDNSWDEVVKEFIKHIQFDKVESQTIEFINWIKQHYTLIKN